MQTSLPNVLKYLHENYSGLVILKMSSFISCYLTFSCATTETELHHTHLIGIDHLTFPQNTEEKYLRMVWVGFFFCSYKKS